MLYWNVSFLVAVFISRTSLSVALLTMAAGLSGCAIKGRLHRETGFSPFKGLWDHRTVYCVLRLEAFWISGVDEITKH